MKSRFSDWIITVYGPRSIEDVSKAIINLLSVPSIDRIEWYANNQSVCESIRFLNQSGFAEYLNQSVIVCLDCCVALCCVILLIEELIGWFKLGINGKSKNSTDSFEAVSFDQ